MTYATLEDFYDRLKPEAIVNFERRITSVSVGANQFTSPGHALQSGYALRLVGGDLPAPFDASTVYYALPNGSDFFRLSATSGGSAVAMSDAGSGLMSFVVDMSLSIQRELTRQGARIDTCLRGRGVVLPLLGTCPDLADLEIDLAAWKLLLARGYQSGREINPDQDYKVLWEAAEERLADICGSGDLPAGVIEGAGPGAPSEAWDANARGWYGPCGIDNGAI